jgi:hypothetical protein
MDECDGHEDLHGSGRWSVIPYIHERTKLYCSSMYESEHFSTSQKRCLSDPFIAQGRVDTTRLEAR